MNTTAASVCEPINYGVTNYALWEWSVPGIVDFKEWRVTHIKDMEELFQECLKELIQGSNLYAVWRDRKVYIFVRDAQTKETVKVKQVDYLGNQKYILYTV